MTTAQSFRVAIIGAGFSGALLAVHLLRRCGPDDRVYLIEKRAGFGRGLAYSTTNLNHLLNVRAANMSAFHDQPNHFVEWLLQENVRIDGVAPDGDSFVSRKLYGTYVRSLLCEQLWAGGKGPNLCLVPDQAVSLSEDARGVTVHVAGGLRYAVDAAVLAAGNTPRSGSAGHVHHDPWDPRATQGLDRNAPVLLIGTGLTMIDTVQSLLDGGHRGRIHAFSRRGLLPREHAPTRPIPIAVSDLPQTTSAVRLTRWLRQRIRATAADGGDWRAVLDGLRPHVPDLWRRLSLEERRRFLRHLRPWWDSHRHRLAPQVARQFGVAIDQGQLQVAAARMLEIIPGPLSVQVRFRRRGSDVVESMEVGRIIDCTGPQTDCRTSRDPLVRTLVERGIARADPLGLGLDVNEQGALLSGDGGASLRLYALGPVTRGVFWEVVAVPDIRLQCVRLSNLLMGTFRERLRGEGRPERTGERDHIDRSPVGATPDVIGRRPAPTWFAGRPRYGETGH
jgi:uncharacterized NAD(P)/FAD-binding protein YdhS